jgi:hypothetical protein
MNYGVLKRVLFLLAIVLLLFSFSACKTIKAAVSFKWGRWGGNGHHHDVAKVQKEGPPTHMLAVNIE